jgi:dephospho-CoA kinase
MDENILVWAPEALRLERVMERDKVSEKEVRDRMQHQLPENEKVLQASFVIINDSAHSLVRQLMEIDHVLRFVNATKSV